MVFLGCNRSQKKIDAAGAEIEFAERNNQVFSSDDWSNLEFLMEELQKDFSENKDRYTEEQINEFRNLQGRYAALLVKKGLNNFQGLIKDYKNQLEGFFDGFMSDTVN